VRVSDPPPPVRFDYPLEYAAMARASKGWTPQVIDEFAFEDFLTHRDAFVRLADMERRDIEAHRAGGA
jgi:hypothetical protein